MKQNEKLEKFTPKSERNDILFKLQRDEGFDMDKLIKLSGLKQRQLYKILETYQE